MQTDNIISPKERLMIAAQVLPITLARYDQTFNPAEKALAVADNLIKHSGCIVAGAEELEHTMD